MPRALAARRHGQFAARRERFVAGCRAQEDRAGIFSAEQADAHVHFGGVAKAPRTQLHVLVSFAIGANGAVVVDAADHVGPVAGEHLAMRGFFEVENIQALGRALNDVGAPGAVFCASGPRSRNAATPPRAAT